MNVAAGSVAVCVGVFVGGAARRMGQPKGLLQAPDDAPREGRSLVERLRSEARAALSSLTGPELAATFGSAPTFVLVGQRPEYDVLGFPSLPDAAPDRGPLGGLVALLEHAERHGFDATLALACDLPFVTAQLLARLLTEHTSAAICAPRPDGIWQPLCARYSVGAVLPLARDALERGELSLQRLLRSVDAAELALSPREAAELTDWDTPDDVLRSRAPSRT